MSSGRSLHDVLAAKMVELIAGIVPLSQADGLIAGITQSIGRIELEAYTDQNLVGTVRLHAEAIDFACAPGIAGRLYPQFEIARESIQKTDAGQPVRLEDALRTLRAVYLVADEIRLVDDSEGEVDDETFVVDFREQIALEDVHRT